MSGDNEIARLFGALLIAVGFLIMALCGLCSAVVVVGSLLQGGGADFLSFTLMAAVFGGVPAVVGFGLFWLGRTLRRKT